MALACAYATPSVLIEDEVVKRRCVPECKPLAKMRRFESWKPAHRRAASHSNAPKKLGGLSSPKQRRERRMKTQSFDCTRSLVKLGLVPFMEELEVQVRQSALSLSQNEPNSDLKLASEDASLQSDDLKIDPVLEDILQSTFESIPFYSKINSDERQAGRKAKGYVENANFIGEHRRTKHRRCQSILIRSPEPEVDINEESEEPFMFQNFEFCKDSLVPFCSTTPETPAVDNEEAEFNLALKSMFGRLHQTYSMDRVKSCILATIRED